MLNAKHLSVLGSGIIERLVSESAGKHPMGEGQTQDQAQCRLVLCPHKEHGGVQIAARDSS